MASALLANGVRVVGHSVDLGRPRGVFSAGPEEPNALVRAGAEPMIAATMLDLRDGLAVSSLRGRARIDGGGAPGGDVRDGARHDKAHLHCEVLVVGGGPAGLAAAVAAGETGARVVLVDEQPELGGDLLGSRVTLDDAPAIRWVASMRRRLAELPEVRVLTRTTAIGYYDRNYLVALERRGPRRGRLWHLRARRVVLATGAHERPIAFPGNDRPGVMLASAARTYVNRYGVLPGRRVVVFTVADSGYEAALDLRDAGAEIAAIVDARPLGGRNGKPAPGPVLRGGLVTGTDGDTGTGAGGEGTLAAVHVRHPFGRQVLEADLLAVCGGWNPAVHLFAQSRGRLRFDDTLLADVPHLSAQAERSAGACRGVYGTSAAIEDGYAAGAQAAELAGLPAAGGPRRVPVAAGWHTEAPGELWALPELVDEDPGPAAGEAFVDLQRDVTVADVTRALRTGMSSEEHVKRYTTAGTGADQGKTAIVAGVMAELLGERIGPTTFRPPYTPVPFEAFAGRDRGVLSDPVRATPAHDRHVARGAVFEDVGQWKRPRYYPLPAGAAEGNADAREGMAEAVARECLAVRTACGAIDASTLGKIDIQGPDAGEFLDRIYTNTYSTLPVGSCRYGVMCTADGMVFDDGVTARLAEDHWLMTTTTGNAAAVLDRLEEWKQTEWPALRVWFTSVTDHWATVAVAGPRSRTVIARLAPGLDLGDFPFMTVRTARVLGVDEARIFRIGFSGELAYEVNVPSWYGGALWDAVLELGRDVGLVPYGTEAMHVLRAEKGFMVVGHETDGTVTPQDLGMSWIVSRRKPMFVGRRSQARPDTARPDRKRLVGLLPDDPAEPLQEGAQLIAADGPPPVPMLGHVTSAYHSPTLGRTFGLALARAVPGDRLLAWSLGRTVPVTVVDPCFYDPRGERRDGDPADRPAGNGPPADSSGGGAAGHGRHHGLAGLLEHAAERLGRGEAGPRAARESPLAAYAEKFAAASGEEVRLREVPFLRMCELRGPVVPSSGSGEVLELGPEWWLIVGAEEPRVHAGLRADVSAERTVLELAGPGARDVLMTGCPIDLHPAAFEVRATALTLLGQVRVIVRRTAADTYRIFVRSSLARHLAEWLLDALTGL